jgi:hypothetical protein
MPQHSLWWLGRQWSKAGGSSSVVVGWGGGPALLPIAPPASIPPISLAKGCPFRQLWLKSSFYSGAPADDTRSCVSHASCGFRIQQRFFFQILLQFFPM